MGENRTHRELRGEVMKRSLFAVPSLLAAGLMPFSTQADGATKADEAKNTLLDNLKGIVTGIDQSHTFTLAQHRSHASHSSHGSHRSSGFRIPTVEPSTTLASVSSRNDESTPPNSVLPSSPAITRKLKILPGNSGKFYELVQRSQLALLAKGYDVGIVDGEIHARTVAALYRYQADHGMVPSGKLTNETLASLSIVAQ
jgi:His-Xaa-Ser repeat protein HxsA